MSLMASLNTAVSGLAAAQHALSITADNVANVNTRDYARKLVRQEAVIVNGQGAGVGTFAPERASDQFLDARLREQHGKVGRSSALADLFQSIQDRLLGAPGDTARGLANGVAAATFAAEQLANDPDSSARGVAFVGAAQDLASDINQAADEVQAMRREADQQIGQTLAEVNEAIAALHDLNGELARGGPTPGLLDRRDALLDKLASDIDLSVYRREDETVAVYTRGGQPLLESDAGYLDYHPAAAVGATTTFGPITLYHADDIDRTTGMPRAGAQSVTIVTGGVRAELTPELTSDAVADSAQTILSPLTAGRLQGLLESRDRVLPALADQIGELGGLARHAINAAHNAGVAQPPPRQLVGTRTDLTGYAASGRSGTAYVAVIDLSTGKPAVTAAVDLAAATSPTAIASGLTAGLAGYGTAAINADGALELSAGPGYGLAVSEGGSAIVETDAAGHNRSYGFSHYFGLNDLLVPASATNERLGVRSDILDDAGRIATARLDVDPGPPLAAALGGTTDNRGAQLIAGAFQAAQATVARGALGAADRTIAGYVADITSLAAVQAENAGNGAASDQALGSDLKARHDAVAGVDLDEELSRLILFQQAYGASAQMIATTNRLFDDLLAIVR